MSAQIVEEPTPREIDAAAAVLRLLADPTRLRIVWALLHGEHAVGELAEHVGAQPPAVSQHLAKLRLASLVQTRRDGTRVYYRIDDEHVERLVAEVLMHADHAAGTARHHRARAVGRSS